VRGLIKQTAAADGHAVKVTDCLRSTFVVGWQSHRSN
jgi:hypothetical protein